MKELDYREGMALLADRLAHGGAFLSVAGDRPNTMTIGWGTIGTIWGKPILMVMVRPQRHTYGLINAAGEFTVSVPTDRPLRAELAYAGTASGRDEDKFDGHGLTAAPAQIVGAPIVAECGLHFECRTLMTQEMAKDGISPWVLEHAYPLRDFHRLYFGEIVACYRTDA